MFLNDVDIDTLMTSNLLAKFHEKYLNSLVTWGEGRVAFMRPIVGLSLILCEMTQGRGQ